MVMNRCGSCRWRSTQTLSSITHVHRAEGRKGTRPAARTSMPPVRSSHLWDTLPLTSMMTNAPAAMEILRITKTFIRYNFKSDKRALVGNAIGHRQKLDFVFSSRQSNQEYLNIRWASWSSTIIFHMFTPRTITNDEDISCVPNDVLWPTLCTYALCTQPSVWCRCKVILSSSIRVC